MIGTGLFAAALLLSWANSATHVVMSDRPLYMWGKRVLQGRVRLVRSGILALLSAGYVALVLAFSAGVHREWAAVGVLVAMAGIRRWEIAQWPGDLVVRLGKYLPAGLCLAAWLVGSSALAWSGRPADEASRLGWSAACGAMGGAYLLAGIAKLREAGLVWARPGYQALLVAERAFAGPRPLRALRLAVARSPLASRSMGVVGLGLELGAVLLVVPEARPVVAGAVVALHVGFALLLGYVEPEWTAALVAVVLLAA